MNDQISFSEVKEMFKESIDDSANINELLQNVANKIYQKGFNDGRPIKAQKDIKEQFMEAFNTIRDAYNTPANREKILLDYLAKNACCCEQKPLIDSGQFADKPTMQYREIGFMCSEKMMLE